MDFALRKIFLIMIQRYEYRIKPLNPNKKSRSFSSNEIIDKEKVHIRVFLCAPKNNNEGAEHSQKKAIRMNDVQLKW